MRSMVGCLSLVAILLSRASAADAWMRMPYDDAVVVDRSPLIVVGRLDGNSIQYIPHERQLGGLSWEHHATLIVSEVLKGICKEREIPIVIHYGLTPVVGGFVRRDAFEIDLRGGKKAYPAGKIEIYDDGNSTWGLPSPVEDAGTDNIWFLRRLGGEYGREPGNGNFGIRDPEDLKPIKLKEYILAYLSDSPEAAVKKAMRRLFEVRERGQDYLDHLEVQRIIHEGDKAARIPRLVPYLRNGFSWGARDAEDALLAIGKAAGPRITDAILDKNYEPVRWTLIRLLARIGYKDAGSRLAQIFDEPAFSECRSSIIDYWGEIRYVGSAEILIRLLEQQDEFWKNQKLEKGWTIDPTAPNVTKGRVEKYRRSNEYQAAISSDNSARHPSSFVFLTSTQRRTYQ